MKPLTVILDAGHGKETPGKRSPKLDNGNRLFEWKFTREVCNKIYCLLQTEGIKCILANTNDVDYKLSGRATHINNLFNKEKKFVHISLAHFEDTNKKQNNDGNTDTETINGVISSVKVS